MQCSVIVILFASTTLISAREPKWFFTKSTVTEFVSQKAVTSSCVVVEETLKPCRHLRQLNLSPPASLMPPKVLITASPVAGMKVSATDVLLPSREEQPKVRSWGSFLGLGEVTVTRTITQRSFAPPARVTFSVRGCRPSRLPFDLPLCPASTTATAANHISPTRAVHFVHE